LLLSGLVAVEKPFSRVWEGKLDECESIVLARINEAHLSSDGDLRSNVTGSGFV